MSDPLIIENVSGYYLGLTAVITVTYQFCFFVVTALCKFDKLTDFAGGTNFGILALTTLILGNTYYPRQIVGTVCVVLWAARIALFLLSRILLWGEDKRFDETRNNIVRLAIFWTLQAVWVWTVSLPVTVLNGSVSTKYDIPIQWNDYVGWVIFAFGLTIETLADFQKLYFKKKEMKRWCDYGVWKWTRHPNYFGEITLWVGIFISAASVLDGWTWIAIASPIFITLLLLFVSGMPILERSMDKKHWNSENQVDYLEYKRRTSPLIPFPPFLYAKLPRIIKTLFFLELSIYSPEVYSHL